MATGNPGGNYNMVTMNEKSRREKFLIRRFRINRFLAILAAISSLVISIWLWLQVSANQEIWPLPGLYLLEMVWLLVIGVSLILLNTRKAVLGMWSMTGAILGFAILGAMSIGLAYTPMFFLIGASSILGSHWGLRDYFYGLIFTVLAGAAQVGYMLAAIRVL